MIDLRVIHVLTQKGGTMNLEKNCFKFNHIVPIAISHPLLPVPFEFSHVAKVTELLLALVVYCALTPAAFHVDDAGTVTAHILAHLALGVEWKVAVDPVVSKPGPGQNRVWQTTHFFQVCFFRDGSQYREPSLAFCEKMIDMPGGKINDTMHVEKYFYKLTEKS